MFSQACFKNSVHRGVLYTLGRHSLGIHPTPGQTPPTPGQTPPPPQTVTAADGTHPTGMHSCTNLIFNLTAKNDEHTEI